MPSHGDTSWMCGRQGSSGCRSWGWHWRSLEVGHYSQKSLQRMRLLRARLQPLITASLILFQRPSFLASHYSKHAKVKTNSKDSIRMVYIVHVFIPDTCSASLSAYLCEATWHSGCYSRWLCPLGSGCSRWRSWRSPYLSQFRRWWNQCLSPHEGVHRTCRIQLLPKYLPSCAQALSWFYAWTMLYDRWPSHGESQRSCVSNGHSSNRNHRKWLSNEGDHPSTSPSDEPSHKTTPQAE